MKKKKTDNSQPELPLNNDSINDETSSNSPSNVAQAAKPAPLPGQTPNTLPSPLGAAAPSDSDSTLQPSDLPPEPPKTNENAPLAKAYRNWFLEYASYVILDRAVPHINDGLKPVQRRILHTLWEKDDGRFHKVANIVGATMAYHPHGDASIGDALVNIAQRGWLIEPQGNFGNIYTGDDAAAARYIEARLTPFAREVLFNPKTTTWQLSYDGRANEPLTLPAKFPLSLLEGADGIAVGLSTKILPHNFNDLCRASINHLQGKRFRILPDFSTGGIADFSEYNDGQRGGKVKLRASIETRSKYLLAVTELPYGVTTTKLIDSVLAANNKGKLKIKHIDDNTAEKVEILIHLPQGAETEKVINQLYVYTDCQISISPATCVITTDESGRERPEFLSVSEILKRSTDATTQLLKKELEILLGELEGQWHWDSLVRIFIEEKIYKRIETSKTKEAADAAIREGLKPFLKRLRREVSADDITKLGDIPIKRTAAYNRFKADEQIKSIEDEIKKTKHNLSHLVDYAVAWFESLQEKYGKNAKRRTTYDEIEQLTASQVVTANQRLYVNRDEGFIGLNWRQHEYVCDCTPIDDILTITADGNLKVAKIDDKVFMGPNIIHVAIFPKTGDTAIYTMVYQDKATGKTFAKRFQIGGITREKLYPLVPSEGSKVLFLDIAKTEKEMPQQLNVILNGRCSARIKEFTFDLSKLSISTRSAKGLTVTHYPTRQIKSA